MILTRDKIAAQLKIGNGTIARAAEFTEAVDTIVADTLDYFNNPHAVNCFLISCSSLSVKARP